jgi:tetratricopeptide (TPR) repeat protein
MFGKLQNIFLKTKETFALPKEYEQLLKEKIVNAKLQLFVESINEPRYRKELNACLKLFFENIDKSRVSASEMYKKGMITHDKILSVQYEPLTMGLVAILTKISGDFERSGKINKALDVLQIAVDFLYELCPTIGEERKGIYHAQLAFLFKQSGNIEDAEKEAGKALRYLISDRDNLKEALKYPISDVDINKLQEKLNGLDEIISSLKEIKDDLKKQISDFEFGDSTPPEVVINFKLNTDKLLSDVNMEDKTSRQNIAPNWKERVDINLVKWMIVESITFAIGIYDEILERYSKGDHEFIFERLLFLALHIHDRLLFFDHGEEAREIYMDKIERILEDIINIKDPTFHQLLHHSALRSV